MAGEVNIPDDAHCEGEDVSGKSKAEKHEAIRRYEEALEAVERHPCGDCPEFVRLNNEAHEAGLHVSYWRRHNW